MGTRFLQGDTKRKRWEYFKDYYLRTVILCAVLILGGTYFLYTSFFGYRENAVDVLFVETVEMDLEQVRSGLAEALDTEGEEILVEQLGVDAALSQTILPARIAAGDIDIFIADRQVFLEYAEKGAMEDLEEVLPEDLYEEVKERLISGQIQETDIQGTVTDTKEARPYGISLLELDSMKGPGDVMQEPVLGIIRGADDLEMELDVIGFFLD